MPIHLGVRRSPIRTVEQALEIARRSLDFKGVAIEGIMGYEAHIASLSDAVPDARLRNEAMRFLKRLSIRELTARRDSIALALRTAGLQLRVVNGGGSGSLVSSGADPDLTEVTAGSAFYCSGLFHHFRMCISSLPPSLPSRLLENLRPTWSLASGRLRGLRRGRSG